MSARLAILAGGGELPRRLIQACRQSGRDIFVVVFEGQAAPELDPDIPHARVRLGAAGHTLSLLREAGCDQLVMAGRITRPSLAALRPDGWAIKVLAKAGRAAFGDDGLLSALVAELEREGLRVVGVEEVMGDLLAPPGVYGRYRPDDQATADIERGVAVARTLGGLDVGQGAVVQQGLVLGVEAIEGTDSLLARCADLRRDGAGGVLVKVAKPGQESRADLPTIGVTTVVGAHRAGLRGIAVQAGAALVIDRAAVVRAADDAGIFVVGIEIEDEPT